MKKLFKKILASTFAIGAMLLTSNSAFAENYKVNIAVLGDLETGKTQIIRRILGLPFDEDILRRTTWAYGVHGRQKQYPIDGDVFECNYYDAPGYLQHRNATLDEQIDSNAIRNANIALIVVDPRERVNPRLMGCVNGLHEALLRHASHVVEVNPNCKVIVVVNKLDEIADPDELTRYREAMEGGKVLFSFLEVDSLFTSAKTSEGIPELEGKIINLLRLGKARFPIFDNSFAICAHDGREQRRDRCVEGYRRDVYCSEGCLKAAEGETCNRAECKNKKAFLRVKGEGFVSPNTDKMYCDHDHCYQLAEGEPCALKGCPHKEKRYLRDEHQGFVSPHTGKMYCDEVCYVKAEGTYCAYKKCCKRFVVEDGTEGQDFVTSAKTGKRYCKEDHRGAEEDWCHIQ